VPLKSKRRESANTKERPLISGPVATVNDGSSQQLLQLLRSNNFPVKIIAYGFIVKKLPSAFITGINGAIPSFY